MPEIPKEKTCSTCDWYCYGTWPGNTCDKWEYTIMEIEVPDELLEPFLPGPSEQDILDLHKEIDSIEKEQNNETREN